MDNFKTKNTSWLGNHKSYILLHHTASGRWTAPAVIRQFQSPTSEASAHYIVDEFWKVFSMNTEKDILRHAWAWEWKGIKNNMNSYSIWIEVIWPIDWKSEFTDAQRVSVATLIKDIATRNNIPQANVIRHKDYAPKRKVDIYDSRWNRWFKTWWDYVASLFTTTDDIEKIKQAKVVETEVSKLRDLTKSEENKTKLHDFNERLRATYL